MRPMIELFPPLPVLAVFAVTSLGLAVAPGPGVIYIVARSIAHGRKAGLMSVAGVAGGNLGSAVGASVGLGAVFATSSNAFLLVKWAGAVYLIYLGLQTLHGRNAGADLRHPEPAMPRCLFWDGFLVALLNPKTALFFAAFLPQFIDRDTNPVLTTISLGSLFVAIAAITDMIYVFAASATSGLLSRSRILRRTGSYLSGGALVGTGLFVALSNNHHRG